jgi:hypothetical protein
MEMTTATKSDKIQITFSATERQIIADRTGLRPAKKMWVRRDAASQERQIAVFGRLRPDLSVEHLRILKGSR